MYINLNSRPIRLLPILIHYQQQLIRNNLSSSDGRVTSQNFVEVLDDLTGFYRIVYNESGSHDEVIGTRNQVVLWNLPESFTSLNNNDEATRDAWDQFNNTFPGNHLEESVEK